MMRENNRTFIFSFTLIAANLFAIVLPSTHNRSAVLAITKEKKMMALKVFSGECCKCDAGLTVSGKDSDGKQLHTGDIVMISHGDYIGTDIETWTEVTELTVIVSDQYINYVGGVVVPNPDNEGPYVMGLKTCGFGSPEWRVRIVKKYSDVIDGERWPAYGFNYRKVPA